MNKKRILIIGLVMLLVLTAFTMNVSSAWNVAPVNSNPIPGSGNVSIQLNPVLRVTVNDDNMSNQSVNTTWWSNSGGSWVAFATNTSVTNTTFQQTPTNFTGYTTTYYWSANTTDGRGGWDNDTYTFRTKHAPSTPVTPQYSNYVLEVYVVGSDATVAVYHSVSRNLLYRRQVEDGKSCQFTLRGGSYKVEAVDGTTLEQTVQLDNDTTIMFDFSKEGFRFVVPGVDIPGFELTMLLGALGVAFILLRRRRKEN